MSGISPFTQSGFELAKNGLWKPRDHTLPPIVYGLKILDFKPPFFDIGKQRKFKFNFLTLSIHFSEMYTINEEEIHLKEVILDIGVRLRTSTVSESVRRCQIGPLNISHALVIDEITPERMIENINTVETLIEQSNIADKTVLINRSYEEERRLLGKPIEQQTVDLFKNKRMIDHQRLNEDLDDR